ncbi:efflux RND transporter periplasmic adaptor subunit [Clostridium sp. JS66]|uniref:efflux RND transporter periplasmic adaptor subunit n=1 Tax=Clostridium sp. JS66 TaxID=3064705 RepID=UPI00298DB367|nr:efflux RND transporter periplasmic adaptor subunit [Clostridium sp. JS66]WPC44437.1 efflux RND transporter periplasmic adaptor subunit [Clostridium sp. JS66]
MKFDISNALVKRKKLLIAIALIVIAALLGYRSYSSLSKKKTLQNRNQTTNVKTVKVSFGSISSEIEYASKLVPNQEISIAPKSAGKVAAINVKVSDKVTQGQILFTLDSSELKAQLDQQQANLNQQQANLQKTQDSSLAQQVVQANQTYQSSQLTYNDAKSYYEKMQKLYETGAVSKQDLDNAALKFNSAQVALNAAQDNLNLIQQKVGPESVSVAQAQLQQAQAGVDSVKTQISNYTVTSPITGIVSAVNVHVGEISSSGTSAVTVIDPNILFAQINVPSNLVSKIQVGQSVTVKIADSSEKTAAGTIETITPEADSKTQSYLVKVKIDNSKGDFKPGMFSKVALPSDTKNNVITVPNETIKYESGVGYVYTVVNGKVKKNLVTTGIFNSKYTEITSSSIKADDDVITEGQIFLKDGQKVKIAD